MGQKPQQIVDDTSAYVRGWKLFAIITCLYFGSFLLAIDINIINVAIPQIATDFKALDGVAWYGTAYLLLITVMQPVYGSLYKHFSNDVVYKISIVIFESTFFYHLFLYKLYNYIQLYRARHMNPNYFCFYCIYLEKILANTTSFAYSRICSLCRSSKLSNVYRWQSYRWLWWRWLIARCIKHH